MTLKEQKLRAKVILAEAKKNDTKPKFESHFVELQENKAGGFYSAVIEVSTTIKTSKGEINFVKNVQIPINLTDDINVYETEADKKAKADAAAKKAAANATKKVEVKKTGLQPANGIVKKV